MPQINTKRSTGMNIIRNTLSMTGNAVSEYFTSAMPTVTTTAKGIMSSIESGTKLISDGLKETREVARLLTQDINFKTILGWFTREESELDFLGMEDSDFSFGTEDEKSTETNTPALTISEEVKSANKISKSIVTTSHKLVETSIATSASIITNLDTQTKTIAEGFSQTNQILNKLVEITTKNTSSLVEATLTASALANKKDIAPKENESTSSDSANNRFFGLGKFDIEEYKKAVQENFNSSVLGAATEMGKMLWNSLPLIKEGFTRDNLASMGFQYAVNKFFPNIKEVMQAVDEGFNKALMDGLLALGDYGKNANNGILRTIASIFGISPEKRDYNPKRGNLEVGPVPFDSITKESIVNIIPGYLRQIVVALGGEDRQYDMSERKFMTASEMRKAAMDRLVDTDMVNSLSETLFNAIAGNTNGYMSKKDKYLSESLMQRLLDESDLSNRISMFKDKDYLKNYLQEEVLSNTEIDSVLSTAIDIFSQNLSKSLVDNENSFDLYKNIQKQKLAYNKRVDAEVERNKLYDTDVDFIFGNGKANNLGQRYLALKNNVKYVEEQPKESIKQVETSDNISYSFLNPLHYISISLYEIYRKLNRGINVFKIGEYEKTNDKFQKDAYPEDVELLNAPENYHPTALQALPSGANVGNILKKGYDLWMKPEEEKKDAATEKKEAEERWKDESDPYAALEYIDKIEEANEKRRKNLLLNNEDENLGIGDRVGRFIPNALSGVWAALLSRDRGLARESIANIKSDLREWFDNGGIKNDIFGKEAAEGISNFVTKKFQITDSATKSYNEEIDKLSNQYKEIEDLISKYELANQITPNTEEELDEQIKQVDDLSKQITTKIEEFKKVLLKDEELSNLLNFNINDPSIADNRSKAVQLMRAELGKESVAAKLKANKITEEQAAEFNRQIDVKKDEANKNLKPENEDKGKVEIFKAYNLGEKIENLRNLKTGGPDNELGMPLKKDAIVTSVPGYRMFNGKLDYHSGIDLTSADGSTHTPIVAQQSGIVSNILKNVPENHGDADSYKGKYPSTGNFVEIKSSGGPEENQNTLLTSYMHMAPNSTNLQVGDRVEEGDIIGKTGSTGRSTGDHLHYEQSLLPSGGPEENQINAQFVKQTVEETQKDFSFQELQKQAIQEAYQRSSVKTATITGGIIGLLMGGPLGGLVAAGVGNILSRIDVNGHVSTILFGQRNAYDKDGILKPYTTALKDSLISGVGDILKGVAVGAFNYYISPFKKLGQVLYMRMVYGRNDKKSIFDIMHDTLSTIVGEVKEHFTTLFEAIGAVKDGIKNSIMNWIINPTRDFFERHKDNPIIKTLRWIGDLPKRFMGLIGKALNKVFGGLFKGIASFLGLDKFKEKGLIGGLFSSIGAITKNIVMPLGLAAANPLLGAGLLGIRLFAHRMGKFTKGNEEGTIDANQAVGNDNRSIKEEFTGSPDTKPITDKLDETSEKQVAELRTTNDLLRDIKAINTKGNEEQAEQSKSVEKAIEDNNSGGPKINFSSLYTKNIGGPDNEENDKATAFVQAGATMAVQQGVSDREANEITEMTQEATKKQPLLSRITSIFNKMVRRTAQENRDNKFEEKSDKKEGSLLSRLFGRDKVDGKKTGIVDKISNFLFGGPIQKLLWGGGLLALSDSETIGKGLDITWGGLKKAGNWLLETGANMFGFAKEKASDLGSFIAAASDNLWERAKTSIFEIFDGNSEPLIQNLNWASTNFAKMAGYSFLLGSGTLGKFFLRGAIGTYALKKFTEWTNNGEMQSALEKVLPKDIAKDVADNNKDLPVVLASYGFLGLKGGAAVGVITSLGTMVDNIFTDISHVELGSDENGFWATVSKIFDHGTLGIAKTAFHATILGGPAVAPYTLPVMGGALVAYGLKKWVTSSYNAIKADIQAKEAKIKAESRDENNKLTSTGVRGRVFGNNVGNGGLVEYIAKDKELTRSGDEILLDEAEKLESYEDKIDFLKKSFTKDIDDLKDENDKVYIQYLYRKTLKKLGQGSGKENKELYDNLLQEVSDGHDDKYFLEGVKFKPVYALFPGGASLHIFQPDLDNPEWLQAQANIPLNPTFATQFDQPNFLRNQYIGGTRLKEDIDRFKFTAQQAFLNEYQNAKDNNTENRFISDVKRYNESAKKQIPNEDKQLEILKFDDSINFPEELKKYKNELEIGGPEDDEYGIGGINLKELANKREPTSQEKAMLARWGISVSDIKNIRENNGKFTLNPTIPDAAARAQQELEKLPDPNKPVIGKAITPTQFKEETKEKPIETTTIESKETPSTTPMTASQPSTEVKTESNVKITDLIDKSGIVDRVKSGYQYLKDTGSKVYDSIKETGSKVLDKYSKKPEEKPKEEIKEEKKNETASSSEWFGIPFSSGDFAVTSGWGPRNIEGSRKWHHGIDLIPKTFTNYNQQMKEPRKDRTKSTGVPVLSTVSGEVYDVLSNVNGGYFKGVGNTKAPATGNKVYIKSDDDQYKVWYMHLAPGTINVRKGEHVKAGQKIGEMGNTGHSSGPHLHYEIQKKNAPMTEGSQKKAGYDWGYDVNPYNLLTGKQYDPSLMGNNPPVDSGSEQPSFFSKFAAFLDHIKNRLLKILGLDGLFGVSSSDSTDTSSGSTQIFTGAAKVSTNETSQKIWKYLKSKGLSEYAIAGIMGNLYAESGLIPNNLQNTYNTSLKMTDDEYTKQVDSGTYKNFAKDSAGYGLAQWTYHTRKQKLLEFARKRNVSISDLEMQLDFLLEEMKGYPKMNQILSNSKSVRECSDAFLLNFERPADMTEPVQQRRASFGEGFYKSYNTSSWFGTPQLMDRMLQNQNTDKAKEKPKEEKKKEEEKPREVVYSNGGFVFGGPEDNEYDIGGPEALFGMAPMLINAIQQSSSKSKESKQQQDQTNKLVNNILGDLITSNKYVKNNPALAQIATRENINMVLDAVDNKTKKKETAKPQSTSEIKKEEPKKVETKQQSTSQTDDIVRNTLGNLITSNRYVASNPILSSIITKENFDTITKPTKAKTTDDIKAKKETKKEETKQTTTSKPQDDQLRNIVTSSVFNVLTSNKNVRSNPILSAVLTKENLDAITKSSTSKSSAKFTQSSSTTQAKNNQANDVIKNTLGNLITSNNHIRNNPILSSVVTKDNLDKVFDSATSKDDKKKVSKSQSTSSEAKKEDTKTPTKKESTKSQATDILKNTLGTLITSDKRIRNNPILSSIVTKDNLDLLMGGKSSNTNRQNTTQQRSSQDAIRSTVTNTLSSAISSNRFIASNPIFSALFTNDNLNRMMSSSSRPKREMDNKQIEERNRREERKRKLEELRQNKEKYNDQEYINKRIAELTEKYRIQEAKPKEAAQKMSTTLPESLASRIQKIENQTNQELKKPSKADKNAELLTQMVSLLQQVVGNTGASSNLLGQLNQKDFAPVIEMPTGDKNKKRNVSNTRKPTNQVPFDKSTFQSIAQMLRGY